MWRGSALGAKLAQPQPWKSGMPASTINKRRPTKARASRHDARGSSVDYEALARFRYELRKFQAFSEAEANRAGLTARQHQALLAIWGFSSREPVSMGALAGYLLIRHHTAVELVDRMVRLKLLRRRVDAADARRVLVTLTKEGQRRLLKLSRIHLAELRSIEPTLTNMLKMFRKK